MNKVLTSNILHTISAMFTGACGRPEKLSLALQPRSNAVRMIVKLTYWINATFELGLFSNSFRNRLELASCAANLSILGASVIKEQRPTRELKHEKFRWVPLNVIWMEASTRKPQEKVAEFGGTLHQLHRNIEETALWLPIWRDKFALNLYKFRKTQNK